MPIQIDYPLGLTGLSVNATAYAKDGGDIAGIALTFVENSNRKGYYSVTTSALSAGSYWLQLSVNGSGFDSQWVNVPASGIVVVGGLGPAAIDLVQLSSTLKALLLRGYLLTTGVTSPVSADLWNTAGFYNNAPYYQSFTTGLFAWNNGSGWTISTAVGANGVAYWLTTSGATVVGPYTAHGTATGIPNIAGHGNAVLATFQPDQALMTAAQVATVPTSGTLARTSDVNVVVENFVTVPAAIASASQIPSAMTCLRGDTLRVALPAMGDVSSRTRLVLTVKVSVNDLDNQAVLQVVEGTGLTRLNGSSSVNSSNASLAVVDATVGTANLEIDASVTALLVPADYVWDVQASGSTGISTPISGTLGVVADVTRTVT